jgi:hypothetical protein
MSREYVIVGGGVHGTHVAHRFVSETDLSPGEISIIEPRGELLASFREKARACGMEALRSPFVHHLGVGPFDLRDFAETHDREDELRSTPNHPRRPTLDLFFDHTRSVIEESEISRSVLKASATDITRSDECLRVHTDTGTISAERCLLAIGCGGMFCRPEWVRGLPEDAPVSHIWEEPLSPTEHTTSGRVCVVGGGITAGHLATSLAGEKPVTLLSRHDLREAHVEADPRWINWRRMEDRLHPLPPGSEARVERVREAHRTGTIPPYLRRQLEEARSRGDLRIQCGAVDSARESGGEIVFRLADGSVDRFSHAVLATGFGDIASNPLVEQVIGSLGLETGAGGLPVLDDRTLEWISEGSNGSRIFVTGALGAPTLGPLAGTIAGARRAADRLLEVHERRSQEPIPAD